MSAPTIGRFAPSPTGPLHFGSLITALASFLDARQRGGQWLVRIEDIDPPREVPGASDLILKQLDDHGLCWDANVLYQSSRLDSYRDSVEQLLSRGLVYYCQCNRQRLNELAGVYDGHCRDLQLDNRGHSARLRIDAGAANISFSDQIMGHYKQSLGPCVGDYVIQRRDQLFSYQLAVVLDDEYQGISHIMRGADLLDSTPRQIYLQQCLGYQQPIYAHVPLALNAEGQKLSKQNLTRGIDNNQAPELMTLALQRLGHSPPARLLGAGTRTLLDWAIQNWGMQHIPATMNDPEPYVDKDRESLITHFQARSVNDKINIDF